jgi:hypothetical protein
MTFIEFEAIPWEGKFGRSIPPWALKLIQGSLQLKADERLSCSKLLDSLEIIIEDGSA